MQFDTELVRAHLQAFDFKSLFNELGWDHYSTTHQIVVDGATITLSAVAHKRGVQIFECGPDSAGKIPEYATRRKIDNQVTRLAHEHLTIFVNRAKTEQIWQWVSREPEQPARYHEQGYHNGQSGEALLQKLAYLTFPISAEEALTISGVTIRLRDAFQRERVTRRFYERFKDEHSAFLKFLEGIPDKEMERWYVSVMINRLMFIYFVQKKGFLDGDQDYLKQKLNASKQRGKNLFYRQFLCPLFFEGFAKKEVERSATINKLLGSVPYFNGGLFLKHQIEELHGKEIQIADKAFEKLFEFFDVYQWHLDERPLRDDREINPDVLGYIFEKYINQKQMGAYYTKEDITGYISKNTILPFLFDAARKQCRIAFEGEQSLWRLLELDPDRYIYKSVRHGITWDIHNDTSLDSPLPLPPEIEEGIEASKPDLFERRKNWNRPAPADFALPTEIWREVVARRQRYEEVRSKLVKGEVRDITDLLTYNLDIVQFAHDVIESCEGPELLRAFWYSIAGRVPEKSNENFQAGVSILDPACGSGAFLFAALNILEPLYETCLIRMEAFLGDLERSGEKHRPEKFADFRRILERVGRHRNRRYFILKSIIINNLFGVDIMEEATEICKLRLFLKLVAQLEPNEEIEALPDIDFNIRAGNSLVGYPTHEHAKKAVTSEMTGQNKMQFDDAMARIEDAALIVDAALRSFRQQQTELGGEVTVSDKRELRKKLKLLEDELNGHLSNEYGVKSVRGNTYESWLHSHKPFHWFIEFHALMKDGGFDVIIGNPPWREYAATRREYTIRDYVTQSSGNLYAYFSERSLQLASNGGYFSFIVQLPMVSSSRMAVLRHHLEQACDFLSAVPCDDRPGKLFEGLQNCRSVIFVSRKRSNESPFRFATTKYNRWTTNTRDTLFQNLEFTRLQEQDIFQQKFPKLASRIHRSVFSKVIKHKKSPIELLRSDTVRNTFIFYQEATRYWVKATIGLPYYAKNGTKAAPAHGRYLFLVNTPSAHAVSGTLNSSLFYTFFIAYGDCFHLSDTLATTFPLAASVSSDGCLAKLNECLMKDLRKNADRKTITTRDGNEVAYDEFNVSESKPIIDKIDAVLAQHYGFTDEELDFIMNYDIKYRMGLADGEDSE